MEKAYGKGMVIGTIALFFGVVFASASGVLNPTDGEILVKEKSIIPSKPIIRESNSYVTENLKNVLSPPITMNEPFLLVVAKIHTFSSRAKINDIDMRHPSIEIPVILSPKAKPATESVSLSSIKPLGELAIGETVEDRGSYPLGSKLGRCSLCYVTGHYTWDGVTPHANGAEFHFFFIHDGDTHWINLTGHIEIEFRDGEYVRDSDFDLVTQWFGDDKKVMPLTVTLFWPDRSINWIHFTVDYSEDDQYIRTIERTFYGNWG